MAEGAVQEIGGGLKSVLARLKEAGADSSAVISRDGVMIESDMPGGREETESFAAMAATLLGAAETAASEIRQGVPRRVIMEIGDRRIVELGAGPVALLAVSVSGQQLPGVLKVIDRAAHDVRSIVKAMPTTS